MYTQHTIYLISKDPLCSLKTQFVWGNGRATAQSALGWYRPSVEVPETLDGKPSGVLV